MAAGDFVGEVVERLIFFQRAAESGARLHARVGRIRNGAEGIDRLKIAVAEISVNVAVKIVGAGTGDDVDHAAGGATVFRRITIGDDLEFLHGFLRNRGAYAVDRVVGGIGAVDVDQVGARTLTAHVQTGGRSGAGVGSVIANDLRIGEGEINVVATVDRKIVDAPLSDSVSG